MCVMTWLCCWTRWEGGGLIEDGVLKSCFIVWVWGGGRGLCCWTRWVGGWGVVVVG